MKGNGCKKSELQTDNKAEIQTKKDQLATIDKGLQNDRK